MVVSGGSVTYTYVVTNEGDAPLTQVTLVDDECSPVVRSTVDLGNVLSPDESWTYTCSQELDVDTLNTALATGTPPVGPVVTDTATALVDVVNPNLQVTKTGPAQAHEGDTITYTFTVTNTGDVTLTGLTVVDDVLGPIGTIESLAKDASEVFTKTYTVETNQVADVVNTVVVCTDGPAPGAPENAPDLCDTEIHVLDVLHPGVSITKTANPGSVTDSGLVTFTYVVTNTGDVVLSDVSVDDDVLGHIDTIASLEPGQSKTLTKTATIDANSKLTNIGTARGTDPLDKDVEASDDAVVTLVITPVVVAEVAPAPTAVLGVVVEAAPVVAPAAELPRTGNDPNRLLLLGGISLLAGLAALLFAGKGRRRSIDLG